MDSCLTGLGLLLDIFGVCLLFFTTSTKHLEAELVVRFNREITDAIAIDENTEWLHSFSFEEHKSRLSAAEKKIKRNLDFGKIGLGLIIIGFSLQLLALWVSPICS